MEFQYFIIFGTISIVVLVLTLTIFKLQSSVSDLRYELKLGKINCQKDLDRLEDKINQIVVKDSDTYSREIEKLEQLHKSLIKLVDDKEQENRMHRTLLKD
jgi:predicted Holliday junction resolvase-like endonuclease|tara:strand:+ start:470 stop:772 length:303 start_codon:yes stop_codon:yes gene_type:complete